MKNKVAVFIIALAVISAGAFGNTAHAQTAGFSASNNWSGYVTAGGGYTQVNGSWVVPNIPVSNSTQADAAWVGIGGVSSTDLIQAGTQAIVENGQVTYQAWYELLPNDAVNLPLAIAPGQSVSVSLSEMTQNQWYLSFSNNSTGQKYTTVLNYASSHSSAEWIEEMPSSGSAFVPIDNFGTISFTGASAVENGIYGTPQSFGASAITMLAGANVALATPSALGPDGSSFSVTRTNSAVSSNQSQGATTTIVVPRVGRGYRRTGRREGSVPQAQVQTQTITQTQPATTTQVAIPLAWRYFIRQAMAGRQVIYTISFHY